MLEGIAPELLIQGGAATLLAAAVLGVMRGWLVPGSSVDKMLTLHGERLAEERARGDEWKAIATTAIAAAAEKDRQLEQLLEVGRTTNAFLDGLKRSATTGGDR